MIAFKRFIYLDVNRTGSTHVISLLRRISTTPERQCLRHAPVSSAGWWVRPGWRLVFTTVRNPWSWYVSLWGHGVDGRSAIRRFLSRHLPPEQVAACYDEGNPAESFRRWMGLVHDPQVIAACFKEQYPRSGLGPIIGLYSYRFLRNTTMHPGRRLRPGNIPDAAAAAGFLAKHGIYKVTLHTERLTEEFAEFVAKHHKRCGFVPNAAEVVRGLSHRKRNRSTPLLPHYRDYYDEATRDLVARRDRLFSDAFGYVF